MTPKTLAQANEVSKNLQQEEDILEKLVYIHDTFNNLVFKFNRSNDPSHGSYLNLSDQETETIYTLIKSFQVARVDNLKAELESL